MSTPGMAEEVVLADGEGVIEVFGDGDECALVVSGDPIAFNWNDCRGSVGQLLARDRDLNGLSDRLRELRAVAENGVQSGVSLAHQIRWLLRLFANGRYRLDYQPAVRDFMVCDYESAATTAQPLYGYYPDPDFVLVTTQPASFLKEERILYFEGRIRNGALPVIFAASGGGYCTYVLDGHHKLQAYRRLGVPPAVLTVVRVDVRHITLSEGTRLIGEKHPQINEYRRVKREYGAIRSAEDWEQGTNPAVLLYGIRDRLSDRKIRLLGVACSRAGWKPLPSRARQALEVAERYADGLASAKDLEAVCRTMAQAVAAQTQYSDAQLAYQHVVGATKPVAEARFTRRKELEVQMVRHVIGNPFQPTAVLMCPHTVTALAEAVYQQQQQAVGPLHDALLDAGLADLADHFADPVEWHPKGCWAVDLLTSRQ